MKYPCQGLGGGFDTFIVESLHNNEVNNMRTTNEYVIEWIEGVNICAITCPENSALSNKLIKLAEEYPDEVQMSHSEFFHIPKSWISVRPSKKKNFTDEQREALRERMKTLSNKKTS